MPQFPEYYEPLIYGAAGFLGLVSCFFGFKLFKALVVALMALVGAGGLAWLGYTYGDQPALWSVGGLLMGGILGAILALFFYRLAVSTMAALFVATSLMPWIQPYEVWIQWSVIGIAALLAALVATAVTNLMIQLASAMLGGLLMAHSASYFITGKAVHKAAEGEDGWILYLDLDLYTAGIALVIGLLGFFIQRRAAK
ncbi:MAG: hypothetical protein ACP5I4_12965 [Oceanipulchritudo sp.]